jgi:DNA modification methylase
VNTADTPEIPAKVPRIAVTYRPLSDLKPDPRNPRRHSQRQIRQIAKSIQAFGFNVPILVDAELKVIAGHGRLLACQKLGWTEVPTIQLAHLTEAQSRAFMIADNRLTENSAWDARMLAEHLKELSELELDFNLEATGFAMGEIDLTIESLDKPAKEASDDEADATPSHGPAMTQPGDLWFLGPHRLLCAGACDEVAYARLMAGKLATMVFADPPYNVRIDGYVCGFGAIRHRAFAMAAGEMDEAEFTRFLTQACVLFTRHSIDGALHYICMDWRHLAELLAAGRAAYTELKNLCVWAKDSAGLGSLYRSQHELVLIFKHGHGRHRNNVELGRHGRHRTNVWRYPSVSAFARANDEGSLPAMHPTVKPVRLVADAILDASARGDVILDPFAGSGTSLIAAERTGRRCYAMEIDPGYADTIVRRWEGFTGGKARRAPNNGAVAASPTETADAR